MNNQFFVPEEVPKTIVPHQKTMQQQSLNRINSKGDLIHSQSLQKPGQYHPNGGMHSKDYYISATSKNMQVDSSYHGESPILSQNPSFRDKRIKNQNVQSKREKEVKCWNKQCLAKGVEKNESKVLNRPIWLCSSCSKKFRLKQYCEYCEQIYSQEELDTEKWMECESKNCSRWNHRVCSEIKNTNELYMCTQCSSEQFRKPSFSDFSESLLKSTSKKEIQQPPLEIKIFKQTNQTFGYLQSLLASCNFKLSCTQEQLKNDGLFASLSNQRNTNGYTGEVRKRKQSKYRA